MSSETGIPVWFLPDGRMPLVANTLRRASGWLALAFLIIVQVLALLFIFGDQQRRLNDYRTLDVLALIPAAGLNPYAISASQIDAIAQSRWGISVKGNVEKLHPQPNSTEVMYYAPYSPFANIALRPLSVLPPSMALTIFSAGSSLAFVLASLCLGKVRAGQWLDARMLTGMALFLPVLVTLSAGQLNGYVLLLLCAAWLGMESRRPAVAGLSLGLSLLLKPLTVSLLAYLVWTRRWRETLWTAGTVAGLAALTLVSTGITPWRDFVFNASQIDFRFGYAENQSLRFWLANFFEPQVAAPLYILITFVLVAVIALTLWRRPGHDWMLGASLTVAALSLLSPFSWLHHQVLLLLPMAVLWRAEANAPRARPAPALALAGLAAYVLLDIQAITWKWWPGVPVLSSLGTLGIVVLLCAVWRSVQLGVNQAVAP